jgi:hypothetical protein
MARPLRMLEAGAWYHVVNRGNNRQQIFMNAGDYEHFLDILAKGCGSFKVELHAYVLMRNHYHLFVRTQEANLSSFMHVRARAWPSGAGNRDVHGEGTARVAGMRCEGQGGKGEREAGTRKKCGGNSIGSGKGVRSWDREDHPRAVGRGGSAASSAVGIGRAWAGGAEPARNRRDDGWYKRECSGACAPAARRIHAAYQACATTYCAYFEVTSQFLTPFFPPCRFER